MCQLYLTLFIPNINFSFIFLFPLHSLLIPVYSHDCYTEMKPMEQMSNIPKSVYHVMYEIAFHLPWWAVNKV